MVKLGAGIVEINGKSGGDIWRTDTCGQHVQSYPRLVNHEPSDSQRKRRRAFQACRRVWSKWFSDVFVKMWNQYAERHPAKNKKGETFIMTGGQIFMKINITRYYNDTPLLQWPPPG